MEEEAPEKRAVPGVDKPFDTTGAAAAGRGRGRRGRRSSRGGWVFILVANLFYVYSLEYFRYRLLDLGLAFVLLLFIAFIWIVVCHGTSLSSKRFVIQSNSGKKWLTTLGLMK